MKTKGSTAWVFTTMVAVVLFMAACGNSQKKKEQAKVQATEQPADSVTVIESETVVIAVDSICLLYTSGALFLSGAGQIESG